MKNIMENPEHPLHETVLQQQSVFSQRLLQICYGKLHVVTGDQMRLVLRSRQQVETALLDFHNELNHLNVNKCLRLLNERYFWQTMKPDVVQWINNCSQCSLKIRKIPCRQAEAERSEMLQSLTSAECGSHR
ncbi:hypothetical protein CHARACLAT_028900 [Characodon lateralis]|uniref:Integrase zinc-binding domain-containing protein n=1 Tax=Characodon lateralis TaxID=208331 RepID=A0ABU7CSW7_9TELE|nr:hypothetical protein [Characodon lateralis]